MKTTEKKVLKGLFRPYLSVTEPLKEVEVTSATTILQSNRGKQAPRPNERRGFNLAEIVVASAVIALMMVSLISYVQSAGTLWQKSHATISLVNEGNTLLDYIEREIWSAEEVSVPAIGASTNQMIYAKRVSDYQPTPATFTVDFRLTTDLTTGVASTSIATDTPKWTTPVTGAAATGWGIAAVPGFKKILTAHHNFKLSSNLKQIWFERLSNYLIKVTVILQIPQTDEEYEREIEFKRMMILR